MLLTRLPLRIATAFDLHVLGLPPAFVLSQDQTLKLNETLSLASHIFRRLSIDESQAHLCHEPSVRGVDELKLRDRQSISRPPTLHG